MSGGQGDRLWSENGDESLMGGINQIFTNWVDPQGKNPDQFCKLRFMIHIDDIFQIIFTIYFPLDLGKWRDLFSYTSWGRMKSFLSSYTFLVHILCLTIYAMISIIHTGYCCCVFKKYVNCFWEGNPYYPYILILIVIPSTSLFHNPCPWFYQQTRQN